MSHWDFLELKRFQPCSYLQSHLGIALRTAAQATPSFCKREPRAAVSKSPQILQISQPLTTLACTPCCCLYAVFGWLLPSPDCSWLFSLGLCPTTAGADLPTRCLITGLMLVSKKLCKGDTLIAGCNIYSLFLALQLSRHF